MKYTYNFGKIDATGDGRKSNAVEVTIELEEKPIRTKEIKNLKDTIECFSVHARVWNAFHSDIVMGGQCLDRLMEFPSLKHNKAFCQIVDMWEKYHLNDMHAGTPLQEEALKNAVEQGKLASYGANNYEACCEYLKNLDLLEDKSFMIEKNGELEPYKYGSSWLTEEIPAKDIELCRKMAKGELILQNKTVER